MAEDRNRLRTTFDGATLLYDEVRPGYLGELFDDVVTLSSIAPVVRGARDPVMVSCPSRHEWLG